MSTVPPGDPPFDHEAPDDGPVGAGAPPVYGTADDAPYSRHRAQHGRHGQRRHRVRNGVLIVVGLIVVAVVALGLWVRSEADPSGPRGAQVIVTVPSGTGAVCAGGTSPSGDATGS